MDTHKLSTIVYAQGYIEDYIENNTQFLEVNEETMTDEEMIKNSNENEHRSEVQAMWKVLSSGLDQLRRTNNALETKLALIDVARNTPT